MITENYMISVTLKEELSHVLMQRSLVQKSHEPRVDIHMFMSNLHRHEGYICLPSKNELARSCKIVQESCMQDLLGTCTRYVPFLA